MTSSQPLYHIIANITALRIILCYTVSVPTGLSYGYRGFHLQPPTDQCFLCWLPYALSQPFCCLVAYPVILFAKTSVSGCQQSAHIALASERSQLWPHNPPCYSLLFLFNTFFLVSKLLHILHDTQCPPHGPSSVPRSKSRHWTMCMLVVSELYCRHTESHRSFCSHSLYSHGPRRKIL